MKLKYIIVLGIAISILFGCEKNPSAPEYEKEMTVYGFLWGETYLTSDRAIMIHYSQPITEYFDLNEAAVHNATVTLTDASTNKIYALKELDENPGFYFNDSLLIKSKTTYHLKIETDGNTVTASTIVPPMLNMTTDLASDTVNNVYPKNLGYEKPIYLDCESEDQVILVDMYCNEPFDKAEYRTPFSDDHKFPETEEEYEGGSNGEPRHIQAYMLYKDIVSADYDGEHVIFWYASMIVFFGSNTMQILAADDNYHHYMTNEHPQYNGGIQGGIGVFGSVCGQQFEMNVVKKQ